MKTFNRLSPASLGLCGLWSLTLVSLPAQSLQFTNVQRLPNKEVALTLTAPTGRAYRIESSTNVMDWNGLVTFATNVTPSLQYTDSASPYLSTRYYRALQLTGTNNLSGDHLTTTNGDVVIHPLYHASLLMSWNGKIIYSDPDDDGAYESRYTGMPKGDLILVTHEHSDHYSTAKLTALRAATGVIIVPQRIYNMAGFAAFRPNAIALPYGASTNVQGITVLAVPGYNTQYHPYTNNNAYVLTLGGKRVFISGDTGDVPEIRALTDIDVAFLCMNQPFTMTVNAATNCVRAMRPKVVYPYHYRDQGGSTANAATFKQWLGTDLGIEVRLRSWY
jgi:L-ascorbate metabolism protein UlaG (beta-lactamase superfamily)